MTSAATSTLADDDRRNAASLSPAAGAPERVWRAGRALGEGAWWSTDERALYWVDIKDPAILRLDPASGERAIWPMPEPIGCCAPAADGGLIAGLASGIHRVRLGAPGQPPEISFIARPPGHAAADRFNDGKCHPDGSFWAGTMDDAEQETRGHFYRFGADGILGPVAGPYLVCNGPAFSPDGRVAYLSDSSAQTVLRINLHGSAPQQQPQPEPFLHFAEADGYPDGLTTDAAGNLWIALWDGAKVACFSPGGEPLLTIPMPVARPTSCAFGGSELATLYVTSARDPAGASSRDPGGDLYAITMKDAKGWPAPAYGAPDMSSH